MFNFTQNAVNLENKFSLAHGDCLEVMKEIPDNSVDMVLCDLPYGTTACKWDTRIPLDELWAEYTRIIKHKSAIVLFGAEPFSSYLRLSNTAWYKYDWYWRKSRPSGFTNAKLKPLKDIETISVFSNGMTANGSLNNMNYYPQGLENCNIPWKRPKTYLNGDKGVNPARVSSSLNRVIEKTNYPRQVLDFPNTNSKLLHPTQKPVPLLEYLIQSYTTHDEVILDNTMGSGSTGVACMNTNRKFLGIEMDADYFQVAKDRIQQSVKI